MLVDANWHEGRDEEVRESRKTPLRPVARKGQRKGRRADGFVGRFTGLALETRTHLPLGTVFHTTLTNASLKKLKGTRGTYKT